METFHAIKDYKLAIDDFVPTSVFKIEICGALLKLYLKWLK